LSHLNAGLCLIHLYSPKISQNSHFLGASFRPAGQKGEKSMQEAFLRIHCYARRIFRPDEVRSFIEEHLPRNGTTCQSQRIQADVCMAWGCDKEAAALLAMKNILSCHPAVGAALKHTNLVETGFTPCVKSFQDTVTVHGQEVDVLSMCGASPDALVHRPGAEHPEAVFEAKARCPFFQESQGTDGTH
jgi:hypothetical protein